MLTCANFNNSFNNKNSINCNSKSNNNTYNSIYSISNNRKTIVWRYIAFLTTFYLTLSLYNMVIMLVTIVYTKKKNNRLIE